VNRGLFTSNRPDWETPPELIADLEREFGPFDLDPACWPHTAKAPKFYTPEDNGLAQPWFGKVFLNPPYGREISQWTAKAAEERARVEHIILLLPARTDTAWWHDHIIPNASEIRFLRGRVKFLLDGESRMSAPFPSAVVVMRGRHV